MQLSFIFENLKPRIVLRRLALFGGPVGDDCQSEDLGEGPCRFIASARAAGELHTYGLYPRLNNASDDLVSVLVGAARTNDGAAWLIARYGDVELFRMGYWASSAVQKLAGVTPQLHLITSSAEVVVPLERMYVFPGLEPICFPNDDSHLFGFSVQRPRLSSHGSAADRASRAWVIQLPGVNCSYQFTAGDLAVN